VIILAGSIYKMHKFIIASTILFFVFVILPKSSSSQIVAPPPPVKDSILQTDDLSIFEKVELAASVDRILWQRHLETKLSKVLQKAAKKGMPVGQYVVNVRFLVEKNGSISQATALNDPGYGLAVAAEEVVRSGPRWRPGEQNGKKVRSFHTQPIHFVISK